MLRVVNKLPDIYFIFNKYNVPMSHVIFIKIFIFGGI